MNNNSKKVRAKVTVENPRLVFDYGYGDSGDAVRRELYGVLEWKDLSLKTKKEIVREYSEIYDRDDLKRVLKKSVVLGSNYGDHLSKKEKYRALRHACDRVDLYSNEEAGIEFVADEMNSIVGESNWYWQDMSRYSKKVLPYAPIFEKTVHIEVEGDEN